MKKTLVYMGGAIVHIIGAFFIGALIILLAGALSEFMDHASMVKYYATSLVIGGGLWWLWATVTSEQND